MLSKFAAPVGQVGPVTTGNSTEHCRIRNLGPRVWLCVWYVAFVAHETFVKHLCYTFSPYNCTRVQDTNAMAGFMLSSAVPFANAEHTLISGTAWTPWI